MDERTLVHFLSSECLDRGEVPLGLRMPVTRLQAQLLQALEGIAVRTLTTDRLMDRNDGQPNQAG